MSPPRKKAKSALYVYWTCIFSSQKEINLNFIEKLTLISLFSIPPPGVIYEPRPPLDRKLESALYARIL